MGRIVGDSKGEDSADEGAPFGNVVNGLVVQLAVGNGNLMAIQATKAWVERRPTSSMTPS